MRDFLVLVGIVTVSVACATGAGWLTWWLLQ